MEVFSQYALLSRTALEMVPRQKNVISFTHENKINNGHKDNFIVFGETELIDSIYLSTPAQLRFLE